MEKRRRGVSRQERLGRESIAVTGKYARYIVSKPKVVPVAYHPKENVRGATCPDEIYLDGELVPGAPVTIVIGDEKFTITMTTSVFIPKEVPHCPIIYWRIDRPYLLVVVTLNNSYPTVQDDEAVHPEGYDS